VLLTVFVNLAAYPGEYQRAMGYICVMLILVYMAGFAFGLGPVPALIVAEIFRQETRGAAYSVSQFLQWAANFLVLVSYPVLNVSSYLLFKSHFNEHYVLLLFKSRIGGFSFLPFLVIVVLCWIFFYLYMPETRGRTFDDIARDMAFGNVVLKTREAVFNQDEDKEGGKRLNDDADADVTSPAVALISKQHDHMMPGGGDHQQNTSL